MLGIYLILCYSDSFIAFLLSKSDVAKTLKEGIWERTQMA